MRKVDVIDYRCPQDHACPAVRICPVDAITQEGYNAPVVDKETCISCGKCVRVCPTGAFQFENH